MNCGMVALKQTEFIRKIKLTDCALIPRIWFLRCSMSCSLMMSDVETDLIIKCKKISRLVRNREKNNKKYKLYCKNSYLLVALPT